MARKFAYTSAYRIMNAIDKKDTFRNKRFKMSFLNTPIAYNKKKRKVEY